MADRRLIERQYSGSIEDLLHESRRALAELERVAPSLAPMTMVEVAYSCGTGCTCHECRSDVDRLALPAPRPVPELVTVAGGWALMTGDTLQSVTPYADVWGDGR